ncbi:MAG: twin-arginine translocation signal domain-containing protein [Alphaproteobacteria bacterium]|nr:twin-arginine translocation signal domain-containing protein [Alphaproteobacteria bacterium]
MSQHDEGLFGDGVDRRTFLKLAAVTGGAAMLSGVPLASPHAADAAAVTFVDPKYRDFYNEKDGYFLRDQGWVDETVPRITWPKDGDKVPDLTVLIQTAVPAQADAFRKWGADAEKLGLRYAIQQVSQARFLEAILSHRHGDMELHNAVPRVERLDPSEWMVSRAYGLDRRNYGEWANTAYDAAIEAQARSTNRAERIKHINRAQEILADDLYITQFGWGPRILQAYNSGAWANVVPATGFGIADFNIFLTYLQATPKSGRRRAVVGIVADDKSTNIISAGNRYRAIGRMIYDRLAFLDDKLNIIPWAAESWVSVDERTWDITLRAGMEFHDGRPVTVHDLKFTLDFLIKYDRGFFWTANQYIETVLIQDEAKRVVRIRFKQPYAEFETYFMVLNVIFPKHVWERMAAEQNLKDGEDARRLLVEAKDQIGSGPFKFGRYRKDTEMQLIANKKHFAAPKLDEIVIVVVPSVDGLLGRLQGGEIDFMDGVWLTPSQAKSLDGLKHVTVSEVADINWLHGVTRISWLPWRDYEFRRAWHHMFDRKFLVDVVWEGAGRIPKSNTFLVDTNPWHNPELPPLPEFDLDKARQILKDAGYRWAADGRLMYPPPSDEKWRERVRNVVKSGVGYGWAGIKMVGG